MSTEFNRFQDEYERNKVAMAALTAEKVGDDLITVIASDEFQNRSKAQKTLRGAIEALQEPQVSTQTYAPNGVGNFNPFNMALPDLPDGSRAVSKSIMNSARDGFLQRREEEKVRNIAMDFNAEQLAADPGYQSANRSKSLYAYHPDTAAIVGAGGNFGGAGGVGSLGAWCNYLFDPNKVYLPRRQQNCLLDLLTVIPTDKSRIYWQEQINRTDSARFVRENMNAPPATITDIKPESSFGFADKAIAVETIAHVYTVSRQTLEDCPEVEMMMDVEGRYGLERALVDGIINGTGTAPQIQGLNSLPVATIGVSGVPAGTNTVNGITYTAGASPNDQNPIDALMRAQIALQINGCSCDAIIMNPVDVGKIRRLKTTQGEYLLPLGCGLDEILCCKICPTQAVPAGTAWVGQFQDNVFLWLRKGITVLMGLQNNDLTRNMVTIVYEMRAGLQVRRNYCLSRVVGLP